jgi:aspartate racemase
MERLVPEESVRGRLNSAIFDELCRGVFISKTTALFVSAIEHLKGRGAECVILGCTEIPLIITPENSPLPTLDSTRLLAQYAVAEALHASPISLKAGWLEVRTAKESI